VEISSERIDDIPVIVEWLKQIEMLNPETRQWVRWHERYLVVYSENFANSQLRGLEQRLNAAENALLKLAAKPGKDLVQLDEKIEAILKRHGNPKRATARPSTEQLLKPFCNLTFYSLPDSTIFVMPLCDLQRQILSLMKLPESLYQLHLLPCKT
jgi:hypothetical protein